MDRGGTIAAIATPPGTGALAIIRVSGPRAHAIAIRVVTEEAARRLAAGAERVFTSFRHPESGERLDEGLVHAFRAPRSATGEDVVEFHGHGGHVAPERVLEAVLRAGARPAAPGEFTRRALLNGKLDLVQAEALLDVVQARTEALHQQAVYQLAGALSRRVARLRQSLVEVMALVEVQVDFPEDVEVPRDWVRRVERVRVDIAALLASYEAGGVLRHGVRVVVAGLPNVGKSRLFNVLLGEERAIVTSRPGTTRDAIEAELDLGGHLFRLVDTAGLRDASDEVEAIGVELSRRNVEAADAVLFVLDATREPLPEELTLLEALRGRPRLVAITKSDLLPEGASPAWIDTICCVVPDSMSVSEASPEARERTPIQVSGVTGAGREQLLAGLLQLSGSRSRLDPRSPTITRLRHKVALESCQDALVRALVELRAGEPGPEKAAADLRDAADQLADLLGVVAHEDVLDRIFSEFCVGK